MFVTTAIMMWFVGKVVQAVQKRTNKDEPGTTAEGAVTLLKYLLC